MVTGAQSAAEDVPNRQKKVELLVADLKEVLGVELHGRVSGKVKNALDEAAVFSEDFHGETPALEVVEDAGVVARDVHSAAQGGQVDVDGGFLGVPAENYGVCLHVVLEIFALELCEARLYVTSAAAAVSAAAVRHSWLL